MSSSNTLTFDQSPPRRPTLDDFGGGAKENDPADPPNPVTMLTATDENQGEKFMAAAGRVLPLVTIFITITAGVPAVSSVQAMGSAVTTGSFNVVDNGDGDTTVWWAASLLPSVGGGPETFQVDDVEIDRIRAYYTTVAGAPAVRVKTKLGAVGTNANVGVHIH